MNKKAHIKHYQISEFTIDMAKALVEHFEANQDAEGVVQVISNEKGVFLVRPHLPMYPMCIGKARATKALCLGMRQVQ